ncbi:hypothetical protein [Bradyrhizobium sp. STM 3562]|uniref:hypothetical protein n=1 Tax=Bradyrhizobium sp. STM 3562 TaxID=578924 RepID=UPI00388E872E
MTDKRIGLRLFKLRPTRSGIVAVLCRRALAIASICFVTTSFAQSLPDEVDPDIDLYALMSGSCSTLKIGGHDFTCKTVAYFHSEKGRADFTVPLDDPADESHVISFSGENGHRTQANLYLLAIDRMLLKSKERPKVDGLPVPVVQSSSGLCKQVGNFAAGQVSSISCSATDEAGKTYQLQFESDGSPITIRRVRQSAPTIRQDPYR